MMVASMSNPSTLFDQIERLQRELLGALSDTASPSSIRSVAAGTFPPINVGRTQNSVEVYAFAPGLAADAIDVTLDRGVLRISGERKAETPKGEGEAQVYARERLSGRFARTVSLSDDLDPGKVNASYRDGVLRVSIGLRESALPQRIAIQ
jgi:HSP20 family protein